MKRSRWPHTVVAEQGPLDTVRLVCTGQGCNWESKPLTTPTISLLTEIAWEHRRAMRPPA